MRIFKKMTAGLMLVLLLGLGGCTATQVLNVIVAAGQFLLTVFAQPPASVLANFTATQATENLDLTNMGFAGASGSITIKISDQSSGALLGQNTFPYTINSQHQMKFSNPSAVTSWVRSFSGYGGYVVVKGTAHVAYTPPPSGQTGTVKATAVYGGRAYASSMATVDLCRQPNGKPRCQPK